MVKKVSKIFNRANSLTGASLILIITLTLSNFLGVIRDHYLTQKIPTDILSAYYAAFRLPDLIFNILILGAITSAFIPIFTNLISKNKQEEAWEMTNSIINIAMIFLVGLSLILLILMPLVIPIFVPGFSPEKQELTITLGRIMLLSPILFGLSYIFGGILNSFKRFVAYSFAPLIYNLAIIFGTILFADRFGVIAVAIAVVIGAFLHFLIQFPVALSLGFRYKMQINLKHWGVRRIAILMIPRAIALGANQILLLVFTSIASLIGGYSVAVYNLADNIQTMPMVVFGTSFATAIFPTLSEAISLNKFNDFAKQISKTARVIIFFLAPLTVVVILLRTQIVRLILGSGHFGWEQTIETANTLGFFALSLVFSGLLPLFSRAFYAMHNTKTPMFFSIIGVVISIIFGYFLSKVMGITGLALAFSIGTIVTTLGLYLTLRQKVTFINEKDNFVFIFKIVLSSFIMAIAIQETKLVTSILVDMQRFWGIAVQTLISLVVGAVFYLILAWIFNFQETWAFRIILNKLTGRKDA